MAEPIGKTGWQSPVPLDINNQIKEEGGKVRIGNDQCRVRKSLDDHEFKRSE